MASMKQCKTCKHDVAKSAKVCPNCGAKLKMGAGKKTLIGVAVIIVIAIAASAGNKGSNSTPTNAVTVSDSKPGTSANTPAKTSAPAQLSNTGVSSDVTITVESVETKDKLGNDISSAKAQGVFKVLKVKITNNQKDAITCDSNSFKLVDSQGREFTSSTEGQTALDMANGGNDTGFFLKSINPGITVEGTIPYDIPKDAKGLVLKAHGGMLGQEITLKVE